MKTTTYYYKHDNNFSTDFTAIDAPAFNSNPEHNNHIPHRSH
jgi:hypothetical protein